MRLKNKKTGEIHKITQVTFFSDDMVKKFAIYSHSDGHNYAYSTLAELNEEWEDVPEGPKEIYYLTERGVIDSVTDMSNFTLKMMKEIGNYFETLEEAEKAVEKLKAWKRLKDFGCGFTLDDHFTVKFVGPDATKITSAEEQKSLSDAYKLLFGGENE